MDALTAEHRSKQLLLRRQTIGQVRALMPMLKFDDLDSSFDRLERSVRPVVSRNLDTSAGLSSAYLRRFRAKNGPSGRIDPVRTALDSEQFSISLRVTTVVTVKKATARGLAAELSLANAVTLAANAMSRLVLNGGRDTILRTLANDPASAGYQRVLGGEGCDFCQMLADRGEVYSAETAAFEAHDRCGCSAEPVYG